MVCTFLDHEKFDLSVLIAGHNDRADFHCSLPLTVIRTARVLIVLIAIGFPTNTPWGFPPAAVS